jgi:putative Holliday junction resolvase
LGKLLGIDHGDRRFGIAISDSTHTFASARAVIEGEEALLRGVEKLIAEEGIERLVLGLPLNMDGTTGPKALAVLAFKERLEKRFGLPVDTWDERLSTVQAQGALREGGLSSRQRAARVDKVAAQIILQSYLDRHRQRQP